MQINKLGWFCDEGCTQNGKVPIIITDYTIFISILAAPILLEETQIAVFLKGAILMKEEIISTCNK